jgi:hypothetical protein
LNKGDGDDAEMIVKLMELGSIPNEITIKKNVTVRGVVTLKDPSQKPKGTTVTAFVNEAIFNDKYDVTNLVFIPSEWLNADGVMLLFDEFLLPFINLVFPDLYQVHMNNAPTHTGHKTTLYMILNNITEQYFLIETSSNYDIKMPKKLKRDFLNIDGDIKKEETKTGTINVDTVLKERREELKNFTFEFLMPEDIILFNQMNTSTETRYPTVDEILDKISERGIESLTETEKEILDNYGKRKNGGR